MAKLRAISGGKRKEKQFSLVYGLRLYPAGTVAQTEDGQTLQQDGSESRVTLHLIEGTREQIRAQLLASIDAFSTFMETPQFQSRLLSIFMMKISEKQAVELGRLLKNLMPSLFQRLN